MRSRYLRSLAVATLIAGLIAPAAVSSAAARRKTTVAKRNTTIRKTTTTTRTVRPTPTSTATTFAGSITLTTPGANDAVRGVTSVAWQWRGGSLVRSTSRVDVTAYDGATWHDVALNLPIRNGGISEWDTRAENSDGSRLLGDGVYALRATVRNTTIRSTVTPVYVDNGAPVVRVTRPSEGEFYVEDERRAHFAFVMGKTTVEAFSRDDTSWVTSIAWSLDGAEIGRGSPFTYDFNLQPGSHTLSATATDAAGNEASHEITVVAAPGPSALDREPPVAAPDPPGTSLRPAPPELPVAAPTP